jgi:hypothetical protein
MAAKLVHTVPAALAGVALTAFCHGAAAEYRCDNPQGWVDRKACAKAQEGPDVLRQYIHRTRMIHGLYFWDYVRSPERARSSAAPDSRPVRERNASADVTRKL